MKHNEIKENLRSLVAQSSMEDVLRILGELCGDIADRGFNDSSQNWLKTKRILDDAARRSTCL